MHPAILEAIRSLTASLGYATALSRSRWQKGDSGQGVARVPHRTLQGLDRPIYRRVLAACVLWAGLSTEGYRRYAMEDVTEDGPRHLKAVGARAFDRLGQ